MLHLAGSVIVVILILIITGSVSLFGVSACLVSEPRRKLLTALSLLALRLSCGVLSDYRVSFLNDINIVRENFHDVVFRLLRVTTAEWIGHTKFLCPSRD